MDLNEWVDLWHTIYNSVARMSVVAAQVTAEKTKKIHCQIKHETELITNTNIEYQCLFINGDDGALCAVIYDYEFLRGVHLGNGRVIFEIDDQHLRLCRSAISSTDNRLIASTTTWTDIMVCDTKTQSVIGYLRGHFNDVRDLMFSPSGDILASASMSTVRVWDMHSLECREFRNNLNDNGTRRVSFSADGKLLAWVAARNTAELLRIPGCEHVQHKYFDSAITSMRFSPAKTRNLIVCGLATGKLVAWDVDDKDAPVPAFAGHEFSVSQLEFSKDGALLASACDCTIIIFVWDTCSGAPLHCFEFGLQDVTYATHLKHITHMAFNPSSDQLVASSAGGVCRLWTLCEWSDRKNHLFGPSLREVIFTLMCVKAHFAISPGNCVPQLPMQMWLEIFQSLACFSSTDVLKLEC